MSSDPGTPSDPGAVKGQRPAASSYPRTDLGNSEYFCDLFGDAIRYDQSRRRWLIWQGNRWEPDSLRRADEAAQSAARLRLIEAVHMPSGNGKDSSGVIDPATKAREDAIHWAIQSEGRFRIESVLALAQKTSRISVQTAQGWDANPWLLGVPNGVVDLRTGAIRPGDQEDRITKHAGVKYNAEARCPRWERFLEEVLDGDSSLMVFMRRAIGYTLTGDLREDCWFGCHGTGSNGKSTLFKVLHAVLGDYSYVAPFSLVERGRGETRRDFDIAYLQNTRFVMASETREGTAWDEERLKRLSGRDPLHAEIKHGAEFEFLPSHKLWFMFNHQPKVRDHSVGFWRRVRMVPFMRSFENDPKRDPTLDGKLNSELEGVLAWAVRACIEWQREGLPTPTAVSEASVRYEADEDPLSEFVQRHTRSDGNGFLLSHIYSIYKEWCRVEHVDHPLGKNRFSALLESHGFRRSPRRDITSFESGSLVRMCTCMQTPCRCHGGP